MNAPAALRASRWSQWTAVLRTSVSGESLGVFRMILGTVLALEGATLLWPHAEGNLLRQIYTGPHVGWNVPYQGCGWLPQLGATALNAWVAVMTLAGLALALGWHARKCALLGSVLWTYVWLLDATRYNNHYYLLSLLLLLAACMPMAARYSLAASGDGVIPFWPIAVLRGQLFVVYFFGGVAKLSRDWLLHAEPVQTLLRLPHVVEPFAGLLDPPALAQLHAAIAQPAVAFAIAYIGLIFDLAVGGLLLVRRTRILGLVLTAIFHGLNHFILFDDIEWFPVMALSLTTIFLEPDWPSRVARWFATRAWPRPDWRWLLGGALLLPGVGAALGWSISPTSRGETAPRRLSRLTLPLIVLWFTVQAIVPLRHYFIPGDAAWTSEADRFSWRMKTAAKRSGPFWITLVDPAHGAQDAQGNVRISWSRLPAPHTLYRDVDARRVAWNSLPEIVVLFQSFVGERIVYNPYSGRQQPRDEATARTRAASLAGAVFGSRGELAPTISLTAALRAARHLLSETSVPRELGAQLDEAAQLAQELQAGTLDERTATNHVGRIKAAMYRLLQIPPLAGPLREVLSHLDPLAFDGALHMPGPFFSLVDPNLQQASRQGFVTIDRASWRPPQGVAVVVADVQRASLVDWQALPEIVPTLGRDGRTVFYWNPARDLPRFKVDTLQQYPCMLEPYVKRIAQLWQARMGSYPQIYVTDYVGINQHRMQLLVDPTVDLAAVTWRSWGHNPWILPLDGEPPAQATSSAPVASRP
ncbi:MAG: HTTM domain-containing protein [Pirellulales bacterium]|nr:HTTM domain-containing protein [Pirellulales bacterium]